MSDCKLWVVIPAAGSGRRFGGEKPKQYANIAGKTLLEWSATLFLDDNRFEKVIVALDDADRHFDTLPIANISLVKRVDGGATRAHSVRNGLQALAAVASDNDFVLVHDAARPLLHRDDMQALIEQVANDAVGGLLATPIVDTVKLLSRSHATAAVRRVTKTLDRSMLWAAQTPQMFRYGVLCTAITRAFESGNVAKVSDEASAVELAGHSPLIVPSDKVNFKVTTQADLALAEYYLRSFLN